MWFNTLLNIKSITLLHVPFCVSMEEEAGRVPEQVIVLKENGINIIIKNANKAILLKRIFFLDDFQKARNINLNQAISILRDCI